MQNQTRIQLDVPLPEERIFRYQAMQDILHHLVNNPFETFTQKELASMTGFDVSSISRSVGLLEQVGVLDITDGKPARISVNQDHIVGDDPLLTIPQQEFREPVAAFLDELTASVETSDDVDDLVGVILFGSVARGGADRSSDIDLLIIISGDATYARRISTQIARGLEERVFQGDRYRFEVLVETPESAVSHGEKLQEIFDEGIILTRTETLTPVRKAIYSAGRGGV